MNRFDLVGKVAIVTGGDWGIGLGIARGLAIAGADIAVAARDAAKSAAACSELVALGVRAVALTVDLTDLGQVQAMAADTPQDLGPGRHPGGHRQVLLLGGALGDNPRGDLTGR